VTVKQPSAPTVSGNFNFVVGGRNCKVRPLGNTICGDYNGIVTGYGNCACGTQGFIGGGGHNTICEYADYMAIGGGGYNIITSSSGGTSVYSFIGGGCHNTFSAYYSGILGGSSNTVLGNHSAILGGSGNSDGGLNYAAVFGCNVTAVASCVFHANNFVAQNMPVSSGVAGSGCFYLHCVSPGLCYVAIS